MALSKHKKNTVELTQLEIDELEIMAGQLINTLRNDKKQIRWKLASLTLHFHRLFSVENQTDKKRVMADC